MWLLSTIACSWFGPDPGFLDEAPASVRPSPRTTAAVPLTAVGAVELSLPRSNRPNGEAAPEHFGLAPLKFHENKKKTAVYRTPLPVHDNLMPTKGKGSHNFGGAPPPGFTVVGPDGELPFERWGRRPGAWGFDRDSLFIGVDPDGEPPEAAELSVVFPRATLAENQLNLATSELSQEAFVTRAITVGQTSHKGLYLPAPATAKLSVTVPDAGRLTFDATLVPPAIHSTEHSDGAVVRVSVEAGGAHIEVGSVRARAGTFAPARFDLSAWAGQSIQLVITTDPGATSTYDYVLLEGATVYTPAREPERIVLVFVDTLRPDHLGFMGYGRQTSPHLDRWAQHAAIFENAHTVAPWTLPSARAALSGRQPEQWFASEPLSARLGAAGWRTEAVVTNAFLSQPFDLHRGWDRFHYEHQMPADEVVARARKAIQDHADRDLLLLVHFMEPHLPYDEPRHRRRLFAGPQPESIEHVMRQELVRWKPAYDGFDEVRDYMISRYDQTIRTFDDAILGLLEEVGTDATVVLFSDHGEEFWEHGEFEHGHAFYEELMSVPLVVRSPGMPAGRFDAPASILDITPTVLELAGLPPTDGAGQSLVGTAWGDEAATAALVARPQAFGRPLYGDEGWGVLSGGRKWLDRDGVQTLYSLAADPTESIDLASGADLARWPADMATGLDVPVERVWRVRLRGVEWPWDIDVTLSHPDGIARAWPAYDPRGLDRKDHLQVVDGKVQLHIPAEREPPEAIYVVPAGDPLAPAGLALTFIGRQVRLGGQSDHEPVEPSARMPVVLTVGDQRFNAQVDYAWVPVPTGVAVAGFHPDLKQELEDLGYVDP